MTIAAHNAHTTNFFIAFSPLVFYYKLFMKPMNLSIAYFDFIDKSLFNVFAIFDFFGPDYLVLCFVSFPIRL